MEIGNMNDVILLATNVILAPCLLYLGIWGFRDQADWDRLAKLEEKRQRPRRRQDRYPRARDRRRTMLGYVLERRTGNQRREVAVRRRQDRVHTDLEQGLQLKESSQGT